MRDRDIVSSPNLKFRPVPFTKVTIDDRFWQPRIDKNRHISLPYQYEQLESSGVLDNFRRVLGEKGGEYAGPYWMDSDAYKWLEAASYSLAVFPDPQLEQKVDETIDLIAAVQEPGGYLNTYFQYVEPDKKFTNLGICHELYCAGHLIQAAVANAALGKKKLLATACRLADHLDDVFGHGKFEATGGHEEIETALVDLYRCTGEKRYLDLAMFFIRQRGRPDSRLRWELAHLDEIGGKLGRPGLINQRFFGTYENYDGRYAQDHMPVTEQREAVGHAVRAMYLYCGMADVVAETGDRELAAALDRLWENVATKRMYITGGIGSSKENEGFTFDYDLPNDSAYAETCAAVGLIMWNHRMLQLKGEGRFADLMERALYNGFLSGVSLDGRKFFYENPLYSRGDHHREGWFACACCPPNVARLLASLGKYIYSETGDGLAVHLYIQSKVKTQLKNGATVTVRQETDYPWEGTVKLEIGTDKPGEFTLYLRIPGWCRRFTLEVNGEKVDAQPVNGYVLLRRTWTAGETIMLAMEMPVERMEAHPAVRHNAGRVALQRGPLVYCLEDADHQTAVDQILLPEDAVFDTRYVPELLDGVVVIESQALAPDLTAWEGELYRRKSNSPLVKIRLKAVPYCYWDNREPGAMTVWIKEFRGNK